MSRTSAIFAIATMPPRLIAEEIAVARTGRLFDDPRANQCKRALHGEIRRYGPPFAPASRGARLRFASLRQPLCRRELASCTIRFHSPLRAGSEAQASVSTALLFVVNSPVFDAAGRGRFDPAKTADEVERPG